MCGVSGLVWFGLAWLRSGRLFIFRFVSSFFLFYYICLFTCIFGKLCTKRHSIVFILPFPSKKKKWNVISENSLTVFGTSKSKVVRLYIVVRISDAVFHIYILLSAQGTFVLENVKFFMFIFVASWNAFWFYYSLFPSVVFGCCCCWINLDFERIPFHFIRSFFFILAHFSPNIHIFRPNFVDV